MGSPPPIQFPAGAQHIQLALYALKGFQLRTFLLIHSYSVLYANFTVKHLSFKCGTEDPGTELYKRTPNLQSLYYYNYACFGENATCLQIICCIYLPAYFPRPVIFISRKPTPKSHFPFCYALYTCQLRLSLWYLVIKIRYHRLEMWDSSWEVK